jgi:sulfatase modifying factor 1
MPSTPPPAAPWATTTGADPFGPWATLSLDGITQRFRWLRPGRFRIGAPDHEPGRDPAEGPAHEVTLSLGFWMADTPVTQAHYRAVTGERPSRFSTGAAADRPVEQLSWEDAVAFTHRLSALLPPAARDDGLVFQLPTEAQWELACRAGTTGPTYGVLGQQRRDIAWFNKNSKGGTKPVGQLQPNAWGLYDVLGNVWEWCADARESVDAPYPGGPRVDPLGDTGLVRAMRGGAWRSAAHRVRAASRSALAPTVRESFVGLRLSRGAPHRWPEGAAGGRSGD